MIATTSEQSMALQPTAPYKSFKAAQNNISDIVAIDYFFAKELCLACHTPLAASYFDNGLYFHLFIALSESLRNGHTCLPLSTLAGHIYGACSDEEGVISHHGYRFPALAELESAINLLPLNVEQQNLAVYHQQALYIRRYFVFEHQLTDFIKARLIQPMQVIQSTQEQQEVHQLDNKQILSCLQVLFPDDESLAPDEIDWQKFAVANALNKDFSIIAGGPGTGKTYTVVKLLAALLMIEQQQQTASKPKDNDSSLRIALVAPTGKAAQRLSESIIKAINGFRGQIDDSILNAIPVEGQTLHRLLGVIPNSPDFRHHQDNLLPLDVLLIDEVSMVDLALMTRVFRALPPHTKVILLGDADQLPSVAVGSVLADIAQRPHLGFSKENHGYLAEVTQCKQLPKAKKNAADHVVFLIKSRRFDGSGGIGQLAKAVIAGHANESWQLLQQGGEQLTYISSKLKASSQKTSQPALSTTWLAQAVKTYYQPLFACENVEQAFVQLEKFRILCATRQGEFGVDNINEQIKQLLKTKGLIASVDKMYQAQPIMISENDYRLGLFNGDIGLLWKNKAGHLMAVFEAQQHSQQHMQQEVESKDKEFNWILPSRLPQFTTVYAMTIHKTQGSEFDHVTLVLPNKSNHKLLSRELLYTGITRAKSALSILSAENVWRSGVEAQVKRFSGLKIN